jgi:hypothetical protein
MKTLKWTGARGNEIELRARCEIKLVNKEVDLDGHVIVSDEKRQQVDANLELWVDGKLVDSCQDINFWQTIDIDNDLKKIWGLNIGMTSEQAEIVDRFLQDVIESGKVEEVKTLENEQQEAKLEERKLEAQMIIEKASKQSKVMTKAEYDQWVERYNNVMNEGGEGYVPEMVAVEQLEWARKVLSDS